MEVKNLKLPQHLAMVVCALAFTIPALSLSFDWTTSRGLALLTVIGLLARAFKLVSPGPVPQILKPLLVLAAVTATLGIYHGERWGVFHLPIYIVLAYPAYWAFLLAPKAWRWALLGAMVGAIAGAIISIAHGGLAGNRENSVFNPIPYGGMALVLAMASLSAWQAKPERAPSWLWGSLCAAGFGSGALTSLLSGSKAGWLSFVLVPLALVWTLRSKISAGHLKSIALTVCGAALLLWALILYTPVGTRLSDAVHGVQNYTSTGQVSEGSVGPRLELWRYGLSVLPQASLLGMGKNAMVQDMHNKAQQGLYDPLLAELYTLHNEFLNMLITNGVVALAVLVWLYVAMLRVGQAALKQRQEHKAVGFLVVGLCMIYLALGVGEVALGLNDLRNFFLFWVMLIAAVLPATPVQERE